MPLPQPVEREPVHTRRVECRGYRRTDGMLDIEGRLTDTKTYAFPNDHRGEVAAGEPVHDMWLRLTVDDEFVVRDVEASIDHGPYEICPVITPNFKRLIGIRIGRGWRRSVRDAVGGVDGCTHLVELLGPIATTAYQAMYSEKHRQRRLAGEHGEAVEIEVEEGAARPRPMLLNSCHAHGETSPVVKSRWPDFYRGEDAALPDQEILTPDS